MTTMPKAATEYYGSVKGMPFDILSKRLEASLLEVEELRKEKTRRSEFTSTEILADRLHHLLHFGVDCDYYYSDWPLPKGCRADFHGLASRIEQWDELGGPLKELITMLETARFGRTL